MRLPAAEAWLAALVGPDGRFDADPEELSVLAAGLAPWEDVGTGQTGPARATFRLAEVQATDDLFGEFGEAPAGNADVSGAEGRRAPGAEHAGAARDDVQGAAGPGRWRRRPARTGLAA